MSKKTLGRRRSSHVNEVVLWTAVAEFTPRHRSAANAAIHEPREEVMSEEHLHALAQIISETRKSAPGVPEHTFFERFAAEHVLKANQIELDPDEIRIGMVGGGGDGGVDGIFLFVNRRFVLEDTDLKQVAGDRLSIELFVVQASRQTGFSESGVTKFGDFTQKCLRLTAKRREAVGFYKEALLNITEQFRTVYSDNHCCPKRDRLSSVTR